MRNVSSYSQRHGIVRQQLADMIPDVDKALHELQDFADTPEQNIALENACKWLFQASLQFDLGGV